MHVRMEKLEESQDKGKESAATAAKNIGQMRNCAYGV